MRNITIKKHFFIGSDELNAVNIAPSVDNGHGGPQPIGVLQPRHSYTDLVALSELQILGSETVGSLTNQVSTNFSTRNPHFYPVNSRTPVFDRFQELVERDLTELDQRVNVTKRKTKCNLNLGERSALTSFDNSDIIIRQADKGGNIILLDAGLYKKLNDDMLGDSNTYRVLDADPTTVFSVQLRSLANIGFSLGILDQKQVDYICVSHPVMAIFHSLPKVHKGGFPPPLRPIVAGIGSLNERLCSWLDSHLQPLIPALPGFLRDTQTVLEALEGREWRDGSVWMTADVTSLYTSIPHNLALVALQWFLDVYSNFDLELKGFLIEVTEYLLTHNFFMFNHTHYLQITGASMGAKFSPSIANVYMGWWEAHYLFRDSNPLVGSMLWYGRYIDDLLFIAVADVAAVERFALFLNQNPCNLKFTIHHECGSICFLDLVLFSQENKIRAKTFRKDTAGNTILHSKSCHPPHIARNIPYGEMIRARRNCSNLEDFAEESGNIQERLRARGYPTWLLEQTHSKVLKMDREVLLQHKQGRDRQNKPVVFSTGYSIEYPQVCNIVKKYMPLLENDSSTEQVFKDGYKCVSRRASTLRNKLSPSLFCDSAPPKPTWLQHRGTYPCGHNICICCSVLTVSDRIQSYTNGSNFVTNQYINCNSKNIIYLISCLKCKVQYVGHTSQSLKGRIRKHLSDIPFASVRNVSSASQHFAVHHSGSIESLRVQGIERVFPPIRGGDFKRKLLNRETLWMVKLQTVFPKGLNHRHDLVLYY